MVQNSMLCPVFAMVALTALVWVAMIVQRYGIFKRLEIDPQSVSSRVAAGQAMGTKDKAGNNLLNLFEIPVLFYTLAALLIATQQVTPMLLNLAWAFVALRALHSVIHCTINKVHLRGAIYTLSTLVLFAMWIMFAMSVWSHSAT